MLTSLIFYSNYRERLYDLVMSRSVNDTIKCLNFVMTPRLKNRTPVHNGLLVRIGVQDDIFICHKFHVYRIGCCPQFSSSLQRSTTVM